MASRQGSSKGYRLYSVLLSTIPAVLVAMVLFYSLNSEKKAVVEKLELTAELYDDILREPLRQGNLLQVEREISLFIEKFSLNGVELYSSDGTLLAAKGSGDNGLKNSFMPGENLSVGWPFLLMVQYSHIVFHQDKPLAFLILYRTMSANVIVALIITLLVVLLGFRSQLQMLFFSSFAAERKEKRGGPSISLAGNDLEVEELIRQKTVELARQRDLAQASSQAKGEYLANISHEIRTSMNGVLGVLSLLQKSNLGGEKRRLLGVASRSADSLLLIINDILDFSKIEAGRITFENIVFNLREVVEESLALSVDNARGKNIGLHCYIPFDLDTALVGDPTRLRQIITNLLSNAVKFTENGEVNCRVTTVEKAEGRQRLLFTVEDTGIGIAPEKITQVFDTFTQAQTDTTRKYGGTGLGLNICKNLVELQNGEIGVESTPGRGTSFWFTLDFALAEQQNSPGLSEEMIRKQIAVFENCETCCTIISQYLPESCVTAYSCKDGTDALLRLAGMKKEGIIPEILLIGYVFIADELDSFMREILDLYGETAPDLFVLARQGGIRERLRRKGVAGIIYKPIGLVQLYEEIYGQKKCFASISEVRLGRLKGNILLVDDEQINQHVGKMVLESIGLDVEIARNGHEALKKTEEKQYDIVFMDVQMPVLSGIETTEMIRRREEIKGDFRQTIVAMTANSLQVVKERCLAAGMNGYIIKPIKPDTLIEYLRPFLSPGEDGGVKTEKLKDISIHDTDLKVFAFEKQREEESGNLSWNHPLALEYVGGDAELLADLFKLFMEKKDTLLDALDDAVTSMDSEQISAAAHAFKGAVNHFAAGQCQQLAYAIEKQAEEGVLYDIEARVTELKAAANILVVELKDRL
ncbi:MAG: ATP-binding protein [Desulfopila sp.]|jgi:signal transduction histidine kinase/CheY-like chemotaxis protein|nr:ATP-binding protein [Desulfopila sp.]